MNNRRRALLASAVGAALLLAPTATLAGKPVKPPTGPCTVSGGVKMAAMKTKGVLTAWVITGTAGSDTIDCSASTATVGMTINAGGGPSDSVTGSPLADSINAQQSAAGQFAVLFGLGGNDTIRGGWGTQSSSSAHSSVDGGAGNDTILADGGDVYVLAGAGNDSVNVHLAWAAVVFGESGDDTIVGPDGTGCFTTTDCGGSLLGGDGNDVLTGGPGHDDVEGGPGTDEMHAGAGDDLLQDWGSGAEVFDCGPGIDGPNDYDGNGVGNNGTGWLNQPEDDTYIGCDEGRTVATQCTYDPDVSGCILLSGVEVTDNPSTAVYSISGSVAFTPTCANAVGTCSFASISVAGNGTFSVSGSVNASGTWTIPAEPNDQPPAPPYNFGDASNNPTTCHDAAIRTVTFNIPLVASDGSTGGGYLTVRTDDAGTTSQTFGFFSGDLPGGFESGPSDSQEGVTIQC
jgi:hemolysin type calcium-binding protein